VWLTYISCDEDGCDESWWHPQELEGPSFLGNDVVDNSALADVSLMGFMKKEMRMFLRRRCNKQQPYRREPGRSTAAERCTCLDSLGPVQRSIVQYSHRLPLRGCQSPQSLLLTSTCHPVAEASGVCQDLLADDTTMIVHTQLLYRMN